MWSNDEFLALPIEERIARINRSIARRKALNFVDVPPEYVARAEAQLRAPHDDEQ
jgi:hypothetical protein